MQQYKKTALSDSFKIFGLPPEALAKGGASKVLRRLSPSRLATLRVLAPLPRIKKTPFRVLKLWCEQSTSAISLPRLATLRVLAPLPRIKKNTLSGVKTLVRAKGLEPSTSTLARLRASQLSYARKCVHIMTYIFWVCKYFFKIPPANQPLHLYITFCPH